jgi:hypothetical protein
MQEAIGMTLRVPGCVGNYDFDKIIYIAKKRFIEGLDTITLLQQARSVQEKEAIILISLLNVEDDQIKEIQLTCPHACDCRVLNCRQRLKQMFKDNLD